MTPETFFADRPEAEAIFLAVRSAVLGIGKASERVSRSQIAYRRRHAFAWVWTPDRYLGGEVAPLVLSIALGRRDRSPLWKQVVEPRPGHFMHHLELRSTGEVNDSVRAILREAWEGAG